MYCPTCGINQSDDRKFCTACGTNLGLVSSALSGAAPGENEAWAAAISIQKRAMAAAMAKAAPGVGMLIGAFVLFETLPKGLGMWVSFGLIMGGIANVGKGVSQYIVAREELKQAQQRQQNALYRSVQPPPLPPPAVSDEAPGSITDRTTRNLGR